MRLSEKRANFSLALALLVLWINKKTKYNVAVDYVKRCKHCKVGRKKSCHKSGLAVDLNLYDENWNYLGGDNEETRKAHLECHSKWIKLGGSAPINVDLNHYSFEHNGMR